MITGANVANRHVNAVVVGAGAGGGVAAKVLAEAGLSVVLLERGRWYSFDDCTDDELICQRGVIALGYGPDNEGHPRVFENKDGSTRIVHPPGGYHIGACVGGGTLSYAAQAWRFMPQDFRMRTTYGAPEGSALEDWPISYEDLEPCYERAEWELGVAGDDGQNPFAPPRRRPQPMPPFPYNREARLLIPAARRLGWHPFPIPMLRNSVPYGGRPKCIHNRWCAGYACPIDAKAGTQNTVIRTALATGNCELRTEASVCEVLTDARGLARGVRYFGADGREHVQTADLVVVAASAMETARLLLNSKSRLFPDGLANNGGWVGRCFQGHGRGWALGVMREETYEEAGSGATVAFCDFNHGNEGLRGGGMIANDFTRPPYDFTRRRPPGAARWGLAHKQFQRENYKRTVLVTGPIQQMPVYESRVTVDPGVRDRWGVPVCRLSERTHPHDAELVAMVADRSEELLREAGAALTWKGGGPASAMHQAGTCRMGDDPATSVTNRYGRSHEVGNLFVADASLHVTNGGFNPVLTILALGYWVAGYIAKEWQGGARFKG
jgi:choline dehydrogenase-like flavoprotein